MDQYTRIAAGRALRLAAAGRRPPDPGGELLVRQEQSPPDAPSDAAALPSTNSRPTGRKPRDATLLLADLTLLGILVLIAGTRFWAVRRLAAPMWGDAYQHTMIAQLLVDHGGLFNSWAPYASLQSFTYHFGFHSAVAVFHWVTSLSLPQATLWTGQILTCWRHWQCCRWRRAWERAPGPARPPCSWLD